jgi:D-glycero-D-manno-heptose 1,7-bisphosphate phosphatase
MAKFGGFSRRQHECCARHRARCAQISQPESRVRMRRAQHDRMQQSRGHMIGHIMPLPAQEWRILLSCYGVADTELHGMSLSVDARLSNNRSALFLDRDGVINIDRGYVHKIDEFEFASGIFDLARFWAQEIDRPIIVISNQSGIGRGYFEENAFAELTDWMCRRFAAEGAPIARVYHCPFHPEHGIGSYKADHPWRKPLPGMFLQAAADFDLDLDRCIAVGDRLTDIQAAAEAGIGLRILVGVGHPEQSAGLPTYAHAVGLPEALAIVRSYSSQASATHG